VAAEISIAYNAVTTLYVVIRRHADGYVWNGTTWEAWADANIGTYAVAMTNQGGDLRQADFPTTIAAGRYYYVIYIRTGASPAISDVILTQADLTWTGAASTGSGAVTLSAYALTDLTKVKRYLGTPTANVTDDDLLIELINAATDRIERICNRKFANRAYVDRIDVSQNEMIQTPQWPITDFTSIQLIIGSGPDESLTTVETDCYRRDDATGRIQLLAGFWCLLQPTYNFPTYNWPTFVFARGFRSVQLTYSAGYATIPDALDMCCREVVAMAYGARRLNFNVKSERLGDYAVTLSDQTKVTEDLRARLVEWSSVPVTALY
jgi:hypothetical protein